MKLLILGFGVVARSFVQLLAERRGELYRGHGIAPRIVGVVDSRGAALSESGLDPAALLAAKRNGGTVAAIQGHGAAGCDAVRAMDDADADVVVEATPTRIADPAGSFERIKAAMRRGRHVISVNKAPLAVAMPALLELARHNRVRFRFSGTVGGGTPMLEWARQCARGDCVDRVRAILNGTTNFILSRMTESRDSFDDALAEAVRLGYAETDPSADIDGVDPAVKAVIFANYVLDRPIRLADVVVEGIRGLPAGRIQEAEQRGAVVKLVAEIGESVTLAPRDVPRGSPLDVGGTLNAVSLTLRTGGEMTLIGRGAGGPETATAVLRDLLEIWHAVSGQPTT